MTRKRKLLVCSLFMCMVLSALPGVKSSAEEKQGETSSAASEIQDENIQRLEETTVMDENANIYEVDDEDGSVEGRKNGIALFSRSASGAMVVNFNTGGNGVTYYTDEASGDQGYTNGAYGADAAYLGMAGTKVRFMLAGVTGTVEAADVEVVEYSAYQDAVSYYTVSDGKLIHYISQNLKTAKHSQINNGPAPSWMESGVRYYSYDGHYFYKDYTAMLLDYQSGTREHSVNSSVPFYNYYQFLPLRSRTAYSADELNSMLLGKTKDNSKLRGTGVSFVSGQDTYGVNALLALSVAANESGWGTSGICQQKNNLFGLNATDSAPGEDAYAFTSVDDCIRQFMSTHMSSGYLYPKKWSYNGGYLGNKGGGINVRYASDPYWGERAAAIAWTLDRMGGEKDQSRYTVGVAEGHSGVNIRSEASTGSAVLYTTGSRQVYPVIVLDREAAGGFYKIQSEGVVNSDRSALLKAAEYDFDKMYAYISADYVSIVGEGTEGEDEPENSAGDAGGEQSDPVKEPEKEPDDSTVQGSGNSGSESGTGQTGGSTPDPEPQGGGNTESQGSGSDTAEKDKPESGAEQTKQEVQASGESGEAAVQTEQAYSETEEPDITEKTAEPPKAENTSAAADKVMNTASEKAPQTGDMTDLSVWAALAGISLLLSAAVMWKRYNMSR